jgi:o-succinylbenzoate synthase
MLKAGFVYYPLQFKLPAGTSRGVLQQKESWMIFISDSQQEDKQGWGECSLIPGLSPDKRELIEDELKYLCNNPHLFQDWKEKKGHLFPALRFGFETAFRDLSWGGKSLFAENEFTSGTVGIPINGLIWMGSLNFMKEQLFEKVNDGFCCIKIKVGALNFDDELAFLKFIRSQFAPAELEIRLDANGAFKPDEAAGNIKRLSDFSIHSIEQPVKAGQWEVMADLCVGSPIPVALDEELIGVANRQKKLELLKTISPQYIILKPSLLGGFDEAEQWIELAGSQEIGWWATSALESNIGLNAIAQWVSVQNTTMPQGLGTGQLYSNNIHSPLEVKQAALFHHPTIRWKHLQTKS